MTFRALLTERSEAGAVTSSIQMLDDARLPEGDVTVDIEWAGLNYKDGLCLTGEGSLVRSYPHVGGIDFAGPIHREPHYDCYRFLPDAVDVWAELLNAQVVERYHDAAGERSDWRDLGAVLRHRGS